MRRFRDLGPWGFGSGRTFADTWRDKAVVHMALCRDGGLGVVVVRCRWLNVEREEGVEWREQRVRNQSAHSARDL